MNKVKPKLGLDLDGVVYDFINPFDNFLIKKGYAPIQEDYDRGLTRPDMVIQLLDFNTTHPFLWIPPCKDSIEVIDALNEKYDISIITSRNWCPNGIRDTIERLKKDKINYQNIRFATQKGKVARKLGLDYFVEDTLKNAIEITENSDCLLYLVDRPYNQGETNDYIKRIESLYELLW